MDGLRSIDDVDLKIALDPDDSVAGVAIADRRAPGADRRKDAGGEGPESVIETKPDAETARVRVFFENIYQQAGGEAAQIPWAHQRPNPLLVAWLNAEAAEWVRPGARVVVVGCGLGDDVNELACRGYDVCGFDVSSTAIDWAKQRFDDLKCCFHTADLFETPGRMCKRFDLVVEAYTLQSMPPTLRQRAAAAVAALAHKHGFVLTICRGRDEREPLERVQGPPYPLTAGELRQLMESAGMHATRPIDDFMDDETPAVRRLRATWRWTQ